MESILGRPQTKDLVPIAERPYGPADVEETVEETIWVNPSDADVVLDLYVGIPQVIRKPSKTGKALTWEQRTGKRRYIIRAHSERSIPSEFDMAIQHHQCQEGECSQAPFSCKNKKHRRMIVGGLAPHQLIMKGMQHRPAVSQSLDDTYAEAQAKKDATVEALIRRTENDHELAKAQEELRRLRDEMARKEAQNAAASSDVKEAATTSERAGIAARESQIAHLQSQSPQGRPNQRPTKE